MLLINFFKKASVNFSVFKNSLNLMPFFYSIMKTNGCFIIIFLFSISLSFAQQKPHLITDAKTSHSDSLVLIEDMLSHAIKENNEFKKGEALYLKGKISLSSSKVKALDYFKQATKIFEATSNYALKDVYFDQSQIHTLFSEFPEALNLGLKSLEFNKINSNEKNIQRDMSSIGYIYDRMYEFKESIKWNRDALKLAIKLKDKKAEALCYGRIGIAFDELAERNNFNIRLFDSALHYNKKAAILSQQANDFAQVRTSYSNIGNTYCKLKDFKKAEEYTLKSLAVLGFEDKKGVTLVNLGKIYLETNRFQEAKKILDSAMQNTLQYGTRKYQLEAYYRYHELDVKKGDYKNALNNYIEYKSIEDSLLNETKTMQIAEIGERYKTADKEREILIQRAEIAEKSLTIQKQNYQLYGLLGLALIFSSIGYLFYNQQKLKNVQLLKENELKDALLKIETQSRLQEQRLRISRDLHDNIGAQLTFIISSLDNLKYGFQLPEKLGIKLKSISDFTTSTIYELRDTIWAMNKSEISLEDLQTRISNFIEKANEASETVNFQFQMDSGLSNDLKFSSIEGMNSYRIIQEAINNALKYSGANTIMVQFNTKEDTIEVKIVDNGKGFDLKQVEFGNGINNMKKRAQEISSVLALDTSLSQGTTISFVLPI
jgi:signal transduction histidine kinase